MADKIRIGTGAGYSGDRIEPAIELAEHGNLDFLVFECLAERTIALAQQRKLEGTDEGYDPLLEKRLRKVLVPCIENKIKIITNMGAANPRAASELVVRVSKEMGLTQLKVGVVLGDEILTELLTTDFSILNETEKIYELKDRVVSANVYLGASPILDLLNADADIVITGRTCDSSLFLAPMLFEFGWKEDDWDRIGKGIAIAHLMECGAQVTGGYFADPGYKDVKDLAYLGFPIADVRKNGDAIITKLPDSGGEVSLRTCKEQLLYEVHDPSSYITADGIADFTKIRFEEVDKDKVKVTGGGGNLRPENLKVSMGLRDGYVGEAQISYGGEGAMQRAELAAKILIERLRILKLKFDGLRFDLIGVDSLWSKDSSYKIPKEIRLRVAGRAQTNENAQKLCNEVEALYTNGPAGGGGVNKRIEESIALVSTFIPRNKVNLTTEILEVGNG